MLEVVEYDNNWPEEFKAEKNFLDSVLREYIYGSIEHVGSTSVIGLAAKPVIDIMLGVESLDASVAAIDILVKNGYCYYPYKPDVMHWFCKPSPEVRSHHLHLIPYKSCLWYERIQFRDYLRTHPEVADQYAELKLKLAADSLNDREDYTRKKWPFIQQVLKSMNTYSAN